MNPASWFHALVPFATHSVAGGYVVALSGVCVLQYILHSFRTKQARLVQQELTSQVDQLRTELGVSRGDEQLARLENKILREFVGRCDPRMAIDHLLKTLIPAPRSGFAAWIPIPAGERLEFTRGLTEPSRRAVRLDSSTIERVSLGIPVVLAGVDLAACRWLRDISPADRGKIRELYFVGVTRGEQLQGVLVTTQLFQPGADQARQLDLLSSLLHHWCATRGSQQQLSQSSNELQATHDLLQMQQVADAEHESPLEMITAVMDRLRTRLGFERASLFLTSAGQQQVRAPILHCGMRLTNGAEEEWSRHERTLAWIGLGFTQTELLTGHRLEAVQIRSLVRTAAVVPLKTDAGSLGLVCLTSRVAHALSTNDVDFCNWAGGFLGDRIRRSVSEAAIMQQARIDALTGLANRRVLDQLLSQELKIAHATASEFSLLIVDADRFKAINDRYGHAAGDEVLKMIARVMKECLHETRYEDRCVAARFGGEELVALLPGMGTAAAMRIAEMVRTHVGGTAVDYDTQMLYATVSIGVATFPHHGHSESTLLAAADAALYRAKNQGRNRVEVAAPAAAVPAERRAEAAPRARVAAGREA